MKKLIPIFISCVLVVGTAACDNAAKTSSDAPNNTSNVVNKAPDKAETKADQKDAQSELRRRQLNSDIKAREQRNNASGGGTKRAEGDLASEVRSKLEANIPNGQLTVNAAENGTVTVVGTVPVADQLKKIEPLARQIKGVKNVVNKATVAPPKS